MWLPRLDVESNREAEEIKQVILRACRTGCYEGLDPISREACTRLFINRSWPLTPGLGGGAVSSVPVKELTLWEACKMFLKYPDVRDCPSRDRHEISLVHIAEKLGKDTPLKSIWIPEVERYPRDRLNDGKAPGTVNREMSTLSKLFSTMAKLKIIEKDKNPCSYVDPFWGGERHVYLSLKTVRAIAAKCPKWFQPLIWTAFYTGMRRGEILGLTRRRVNLAERMIYLGPEDTKEKGWKRVPVDQDLVPILRDVLDGPALLSGKVFGLRDRKGVRELELESFKNCWERSCKALEMEDPLPRFHDVRHTWKVNARRSGIHPEIEKAIMGHSQRRKSVHEGYGLIDDSELLQAIDRLTFDDGETKILVSGRKVQPKWNWTEERREENENQGVAVQA